MATITRTGYGQVEPNHLSAQRTGQIYAQLPAASKSGTTLTAIAQLEQGQFLKYNYKDGIASLAGDGEWMLVYCEEKLYDSRRQMHKDFCMKASDYSDGYIYPRLFKTNIGDIYTTNTFASAAAGPDTTVVGPALVEGNFLTVNASGFLEKSSETSLANITATPVFQVVKADGWYMPDGVSAGVKIQRVK